MGFIKRDGLELKPTIGDPIVDGDVPEILRTPHLVHRELSDEEIGRTLEDDLLNITREDQEQMEKVLIRDGHFGLWSGYRSALVRTEDRMSSSKESLLTQMNSLLKEKIAPFQK